MRLIVSQRGYHFKIFHSKDIKNPIYTAEIFTNRKKDILKIADSEGKLVSTIKQINYSNRPQWNWNCEYEFLLINENKKYNVKCVKYLKRYWTAISEDEKRQLNYFGHNGRKKSIFHNDRQIALIDKDYLHFFNRDTILIDLNKDENPLPIVTFALLFELNVDNDGSAFTIDLGSFGQFKKLDTTWKPS